MTFDQKIAILFREDGTVMGPYEIVGAEPTPTDDPDTEAVTVTLNWPKRR